ILHLRVLSGQQLPRPRNSNAKGDSSDPFVVIEIFGIPGDCAEERTKTVRNDGHNPSFDESFQFQVSVPELALVRFLVLDDDFIAPRLIGQMMRMVWSVEELEEDEGHVLNCCK
ncbi:C2 domain protein, partial [Teladorsagia circumcincta]